MSECQHRFVMHMPDGPLSTLAICDTCAVVVHRAGWEALRREREAAPAGEVGVTGSELMAVIGKAREELQRRGVTVDARALLRELEDDAHDIGAPDCEGGKHVGSCRHATPDATALAAPAEPPRHACPAFGRWPCVACKADTVLAIAAARADERARERARCVALVRAWRDGRDIALYTRGDLIDAIERGDAPSRPCDCPERFERAATAAPGRPMDDIARELLKHHDAGHPATKEDP